MHILDIHTHLLDLKSLDQELLDFIRSWKMRTVISCLGLNGEMWRNPSFGALQMCNGKVATLVQKHPEIFYGFCYINPRHGSKAIKEIKRCIRNYGMKGIKLWIACRCNKKKVFPVIEAAIDYNIPVLQHAYVRKGPNLPGESYPEDVAELAKKYPQVKIIMAHMGFNWKRGIDAVKFYKNISVDTSGFDPEFGSIEYAVKQLGAGRILYGSDAPGRDILCQIGKVNAADISERDKAHIFFQNARFLLRTK